MVTMLALAHVGGTPSGAAGGVAWRQSAVKTSIISLK